MSVEKIKEKILKEGEAEIRKILEDSKKEADSIVSQEKGRAEKKAELIVRRGIEAAKFEKQRLISEAILEAKKRKTELQSEMIEFVLEKARERLGKLPAEKYREVLEKLAVEACSQLDGEKVQLIVRRRDRKHIDLKKLSKKLKKEIRFGREGLREPGVVAQSGGVIVDNRFMCRLERNKEQLRVLVTEVLND